MGSFKSDFLRILSERGFIRQCSDESALDALAVKGAIAGYVGFDCTAESLHVGNLVSIMLLRHLQRSGHRPIVVVGGGTTRIGDPSGRDESRSLLSDAEIAQNIAGIESVFRRVLDFEGERAALLANNNDWLEGLNYTSFLRDVGRHFSVNRMLTMDSVRLRLEREQALSFLEFNYMIVQAYDFLELWRRYGCSLQMGGADQWGNIVQGIDLIRRTEGGEAFALTTPLLTTAAGAKMGKTAKGAVWLNEEMLSVYDYWQFWRNAADGDVGRFLRLFTDLPMGEVLRLESLEGEELNEAKKVLATEASAIVHGRAAAEGAAGAGAAVFEGVGRSEAMPSSGVSRRELEAGFGLLEALRRVGLADSNSGARRHVRAGAARVNDETIRDEAARLTPSDLKSGTIKLSVGRKRHALLTCS